MNINQARKLKIGQKVVAVKALDSEMLGPDGSYIVVDPMIEDKGQVLTVIRNYGDGYVRCSHKNGDHWNYGSNHIRYARKTDKV